MSGWAGGNGNYQLMDEEYTGKRVVQLGINSSWTRNLLEEVLFRR
jgi:hypothetical protein